MMEMEFGSGLDSRRGLGQRDLVGVWHGNMEGRGRGGLCGKVVVGPCCKRGVRLK